MQIVPDTVIARLATRHPQTIEVFQRHGLDFCCRGGRSLAAACEERGLDLDALREELAAAVAGDGAEERTDWSDAPLGELIDHIVDRYHERLREQLPRLEAMAKKVVDAHGERYPETLPAVAATLGALKAELESHTAKEEHVLFPAIRGLGSGATGGAAGTGSPPLGAVVTVMEEEHLEAARALAELRRLTDGYRAPAGACPTFRGLYHGLAVLERDTHRHIHLENNVLFPRATGALAA